jgi:poly(3-hydroxybutyrate) depolymerase
MPATATPDRAEPRTLSGRWLDAWGALAHESALGWLELAERGPRPLAPLRWWRLVGERRPPRWASEHRVVLETPLARLRDFSPPGAAQTLPVLVLPPQAGHDSCIVDYSAEQSQMRTIVAAGLQRAFTLDWVGATAATAGASIDDYLEVIDQAVARAGGRVNLIGDCQGGWLATIYAALEPERVNTLTIAGAPIDFHAGEPVIGELVRWLAPHGNLAFYERLVGAAGGVLPGREMLRGFVAISPADEISRQLALLRHLDDPAYVARYREFEDWFKHTQDIPGAFYLWIVRHLFCDNELVAGSLEIGGRRVELSRLGMPLALLAGAEDHITPPDQVFALADHASTPGELVVRELASGGHLGLFMGHDALAQHWPPILAAIARHSS